MMRFLLSFFVLIFPLLSIAAAEEIKTDDPIQTQLQTFMETYHIPGMSVSLFQKGEPRSYYLGYGDREKKQAITEKSIFEIGSITKLFTSLLLAQKVDYAKMGLNDSIAKYVENLPDNTDQITLRQLATHTAGFPFEILSVEDEPDKVYHYSNVGIGLLGNALEKFTEQPISEIYRNKIVNIIGMKAMTLEVSKKQLPNLTQGYSKEDEKVSPSSSEKFIAAWGIKLSGYDAKLFLNSALGLPGTPDSIYYPMRLTQSTFIRLPDFDQGLGWELHPLEEESIDDLLKADDDEVLSPKKVLEVYNMPLFHENSLMDKTGATEGYSAYIAILPQKKSGIFIMVNKRIDRQAMIKLGRNILFAL